MTEEKEDDSIFVRMRDPKNHVPLEDPCSFCGKPFAAHGKATVSYEVGSASGARGSGTLEVEAADLAQGITITVGTKKS